MTDPLAKHNFKVGDRVTVRGWPPSPVLTVIDTSDPSLLTLQTVGGAQLRVGRLACERIPDQARLG